MAWTPTTRLPQGPIPKSQSEVVPGGECDGCGALAGQPCRTPECSTYDYDDT